MILSFKFESISIPKNYKFSVTTESVTFGKLDKRPIDQRRPVNMKITVNFVTVIFYGKVESYSLNVHKSSTVCVGRFHMR